MWIIILFDLPMKTPENRKNYRSYLSEIKNLGFNREQFSVYSRQVETKDKCEALRSNVLRICKSTMGKTIILSLSDKQFTRTTFLSEGERQIKKTVSQQLSFF